MIKRRKKEALIFCPTCRQPRRARRERPNHVLHAFLTIATVGLWLVIWLLDAYTCPEWHCDVCGSEIRP